MSRVLPDRRSRCPSPHNRESRSAAAGGPFAACAVHLVVAAGAETTCPAPSCEAGARPACSGSEPTTRLLHRRQRSLRPRQWPRPQVDARRLGGERDLLTGRRVAALRLLRRPDATVNWTKPPIRTFSALPSSSNAVSARFASALLSCARSATAVASCVCGSATAPSTGCIARMTGEFKPARRTDARQAGAYVPLSSGATPGIRRESRGDDCRIPQPAPNRCRSDGVRLYAVCCGGRWRYEQLCALDRGACHRRSKWPSLAAGSATMSMRSRLCSRSRILVMSNSPANLTVFEGYYDNRTIKSVRQGLPAVAYIRAGERPTAVAERPSRARQARRRAGRLLLHPPPRTGLRPSRLRRCSPTRPGSVSSAAAGRRRGRRAPSSRWLAAGGVLGANGALTAQQVADELDVTLGTLAVTERELARVLNLSRYAHRLPAARGRTG